MSDLSYEFDQRVEVSGKYQEAATVLTLWRTAITPGNGQTTTVAMWKFILLRELAMKLTGTEPEEIDVHRDPVKLELNGDGRSFQICTYRECSSVHTALAFIAFFLLSRAISPSDQLDLKVSWRQGGRHGDSLYRVVLEPPATQDGPREISILWNPAGLDQEGLETWEKS